jgi:hypothetical protein
MTDAQMAEMMPILRSLADSLQRIAHIAERGERRRGLMAATDDGVGVRPMRQDHTERDLAKAVDYLNRAGE